MTDPADLMAKITFYEALVKAALDESKAFHTHGHVKHAPSSRNRTRTQLQTFVALADREPWMNLKKYQANMAKARLQQTKTAFRAALTNAVQGYKTKRYSANEMKVLAKTAFDAAYTEAYALGLKAAGLTRLDFARKTAVSNPSMDPNDEAWLKTSLAHERRYWNEFVQSIITGSIDARWRVFSIDQRIEMYVRTLDHVYETARVVGHPSHVILHWILHPAEHCEGCILLAKNSPYTRETLPAVPRAGATQCVSNCRCELRIVTPATVDQWEQVRKRGNRTLLVSKLKSLKRR